MIRVKRSLTILGLCFVLIACSPSLSVSLETPTPVGSESILSSPTPWVGGTETAVAVSAAETQSQNVLPTLPPPTLTPSGVQMPTDFSPVLYGGKVNDTSFFLLLGGVNKETWLAPEMSVARFSGEVTYSLHSLTQESKYFVSGKAPEFSPTCKTYSVGTDAALEETSFVGVLDSWYITKRPVTELADGERFYQQAVIDWLKSGGISAPLVDSLHVYRVDIEGDGTDEVFLSATHLDDSQHTTQAGDYSIVLLRQVIGNDTVTKLVAGDVYRSQDQETTFPRTYSLANFIDLNQDGALEVVVEIQKWEGFGARVFQIDGEDVIQTLSAEC